MHPAVTCLLAIVIPVAGGANDATVWHFVDRTVEARLTVDDRPVEHGYPEGADRALLRATGGAAGGDFDGDGWPDLYVVRGTLGPNLLFRNRGDGTFEEVGASAGVDELGGAGSGPLFVDLDGDGWQDLIVGGFGARAMNVFRNRGDGSFEDVTEATGIEHEHATFSIACGDYDLDGDLDVYTSHWGCPAALVGHLWRNDGELRFTDVDEETNAYRYSGRLDFTFTPNFADVTNDGRPDLLIAADFETSQILHNDGQGGFVPVALGVAQPDENGMGAAIGDYDNDGDLDWFVTSVWDFDGDPEFNWGVSGNRMYQNRGNGTFVDATDHCGVREGDWGWGASFADFDNDGWLDIFMVNGWDFMQFLDDRARLFVNTQDGRFEERGDDLGVADTGQGRGVVCFDYDRDGDLDLVIANNSGPLRLLRNETPGTANFVRVQLRGDAPNTQAIGARVYVRTETLTQMRELRAGSNYVSSNPVEAHVGLGDAETIRELEIVWPNGRSELHQDLAANQFLTFFEATTPVDLSDFAASRVDEGVRVSWQLSSSAMARLRAVRLQSSASAAGPFLDLEVFAAGLAQTMSHVDRAVGRAARWYRLVLEGADGDKRTSTALFVASTGRAPSVDLVSVKTVGDGAHIRYRVSGVPTDVVLQIYDVRGRHVATPLRDVVQPGLWTLEWPARTVAGRRLPHGLYLVRLETRQSSQQAKLVLAPR